MQITAKSKKIVTNRIDGEKKGNNYIMLPNKKTSSNKLSNDGLNRDGINKQNLIQKYSCKYNYEPEDIDSYSNNCNTTRGNYSKKNEKNCIGDTSNLDEDTPKIVYEKFKFKKQEINVKNCELEEAKLKVLLKTQSFDNFVNEKHKDRMLNYNSLKGESYRVNINTGKIQKSPYAIFSRTIVKSRTIGKEIKEKDINIFNNYKQQRQKKENFLSTDYAYTNTTNYLANNLNNKNYNYNLLNNSNTTKKTLYPQTTLKSNLHKFDRFKILNNSIKEESKITKDNLISEHNLTANTKHSSVNIWERKKLNFTNSKPPKTPKTSPKLSCETPNKIPNNNYSSQKEQDILAQIPKNSALAPSSAKKISLRKISCSSAKNENEISMRNNSGSKRNSDIKMFNPIVNFKSKTNSKNIISSLIQGINSTENTFQLKNRLGKTKLNDSNERSDKKKQNLFESLKLNKYDIPKFSLNEKLLEEKIDNTYMASVEPIRNGNPGLNSSENEKTQTTPNLSTERTELTDKTIKAFKKEEGFSPFKIYQQEGFEDNLSTSSINYKDENNQVKNINQLCNLEQIINNNLNYLNQNLKNVSPLKDLMAKTKKFSYTDLTPLYSTNNPNKVKISHDNLKRNIERDNAYNAVEDFRQRILNLGKDEVEKNLQEQLDNCDSTNLIHNSSEEDEYSSDEMIDKVNDPKCNRINNPIISRIKKNSFAVNISEEEFNFSEDENIKITTVPVFKSKKLEHYVKDTSNIHRRNSIEEKMSREKLFHFIYIKNKKFKDSFVSFLSRENLLNFSFSNKLFRSITKNCLVDNIMSTILNNDDNDFHVKIWKSISHHSKLSQTKFLRKDFLDNLFQKSNYEEEIRKDLLRTMPEDPTFQPGKENYKKLFNILFAYSNYNKKIGYAQGINFIIANTLYIIAKEEEAFMFIDSLVNKLNLNDIIGINEIAIRNKLEIVGRLIEKYTPSIVKFLDKNFLNHEFFTTGWIIPLLSNSIKKEILFKFWDFLFIYGWNFFYYFIVSILCTFENKILVSDPNILSVFIKKLLKSDLFDKSFDGIIQKTFDMLKKEII